MEDLNRLISGNLRAARLEKGLSLDELAQQSGVSKSVLAQIEHGGGNPTLSTLNKAAAALHLPFHALLAAPEPAYDVVRLPDVQPVTENDGGVRNYTIFPETESRPFSLYLLQAEPENAWSSAPHLRGTEELVTVLSGSLGIRAGGRTFPLEASESLRFQADVPHAYRVTGGRPASFINILYLRNPRGTL